MSYAKYKPQKSSKNPNKNSKNPKLKKPKKKEFNTYNMKDFDVYEIKNLWRAERPFSFGWALGAYCVPFDEGGDSFAEL